MTEALTTIVKREILDWKQEGEEGTVAFDLDNTILRPDKAKLFQLLWKRVLGYLDSASRGVLSNYTIEDLIRRSDFGVGWYLDMKLGYLLQIEPDGSIIIARKGKDKMPDEDIYKVYGKERKINLELPLNPDHDKPRFLLRCDIFDDFEFIIKSAVRTMHGPPPETTIMKIDEALWRAHRKKGFKIELMAHPKDYGIVYDPQVQELFKRIDSSFSTSLLTSATARYTQRMLNFLRIYRYFDLVIHGLKKPACFQPEHENHSELMERFRHAGLDTSKRILYVGDHLYKDAVIASQSIFMPVLVMDSFDLYEVMRKLGKYAGIEFERQGRLLVPKNGEHSINVEKDTRTSNYLDLILKHVYAIITDVRGLEPILFYR